MQNLKVIFDKSIMYVILLILYICRKFFNFKFLWFVQKRFVFFMHLYFVHNCCCPFSECALSCTTLFFFLSVRFRVQLCFFFFTFSVYASCTTGFPPLNPLSHLISFFYQFPTITQLYIFPITHFIGPIASPTSHPHSRPQSLART